MAESLYTHYSSLAEKHGCRRWGTWGSQSHPTVSTMSLKRAQIELQFPSHWVWEAQIEFENYLNRKYADVSESKSIQNFFTDQVHLKVSYLYNFIQIGPVSSTRLLTTAITLFKVIRDNSL